MSGHPVSVTREGRRDTSWSVLLPNGVVLRGRGPYGRIRARRRAQRCADDVIRTGRWYDGHLTGFTLSVLLSGESVEVEMEEP